MTSTDSTIRTMLSEGNIQAILDTLGVDRREEYTLRSINASVADSTVTLAQVGRALIVGDDQGIRITVHGHDEFEDESCWQHLTTETRAHVDVHNTMAEAIRTDAGAQHLLSLGAPEEMVAGAWQMRQQMLTEPTPDTSGMPVVGNPFVPATADLDGPTVDLGPTGFYL